MFNVAMFNVDMFNVDMFNVDMFNVGMLNVDISTNSMLWTDLLCCKLKTASSTSGW